LEICNPWVCKWGGAEGRGKLLSSQMAKHSGASNSSRYTKGSI
jgi:hypothetical protein